MHQSPGNEIGRHDEKAMHGKITQRIGYLEQAEMQVYNEDAEGK
jgi:hypothetical protein